MFVFLEQVDSIEMACILNIITNENYMAIDIVDRKDCKGSRSKCGKRERPRGIRWMLDHFKGRMVDEGGQALVEYALLLAFILVATIGVLRILGVRTGNTFQAVVNALP
jgi:Flp pilus assembly pilin Flp